MEKRKRNQALPGEAGGEDIRVSQQLTAAVTPTVSASQASQIQKAHQWSVTFCHIRVFNVAALQKKDE